MKVFISWSGVASRAVAEALADWFPKVIQGVVPFVSAKDIDKGANWTVELTRELDDSQFGIVCLTPDNLLSPWLNYEAGAIAKSVSSRVCPVLHGVDKGAVKPPMAQLQMTSIDVEDFTLLMASMNKAAGEPLTPTGLGEAVKVWWPMLDAKIGSIPVPPAPDIAAKVAEPEQPRSSESEILQELLNSVRHFGQRLRSIEESLEPRPVARRVDPHRELQNMLREAGITCHGIGTTNTGLRLICDFLPDPLPAPLYDVLGDYARLRRRTLVLTDRKRDVEFDVDGAPSEPPF